MKNNISICFPVGGLLIYGEMGWDGKAHTSVMVTCVTECREKKPGDCPDNCLDCPHDDHTKEKKYLKQYRRAMINAVKAAYTELSKVEVKE